MRIQSILQFAAIATGLAAASETRPLPVLFEQHGVSAYRVRGNGYAVAVSGEGMALATAGGTAKLAWIGARTTLVQPLEPLATRVNYLTGKDRREWRTGIATFGRLRMAGLYPGIDVVYYGTDRQLEYDFVVKPNADAGAIRFALPATMGADGELALANGLRWRKPVARQDGREIAARFEKRGDGVFGIAVDGYNRTRELVIDPVLTYGTYLGGALADEARGVAADAAGNAYIVGATSSVDFPGTTRGQTFGGQDVFVAKLNPSGRALLWATYLGGTGADLGTSIALDAAGAIYITGQTGSTNFPVTANAPQPVLAGGSGVTDAFILKLAANGTNLVYSTYLGGTQNDFGNALALDRTGAAYIGGRTDSTDYPSTARDTLPARGAGDGFVTKMAPDGASILFSVLLGGFALDGVNAIAVDATGAVFATGETRSDNFPVTEFCYQKDRRGSSDAFALKLTPEGTGLIYSTYFGGDGQENGRGIAIDAIGNSYVVGVTGSNNMPVSFNGAQRSPLLLPDGFAAKLDSAGRSLIYGTYIGGDAEDQATSITVDAGGSAYIGGYTTSANFPLFNDGPLSADGPRGGFDGFVTRLSSGGNFFQFSTYYGGAGADSILGIATDSRGRIWVAGATESENLPTSTGALATKAPGAMDGFVALLSEISVVITPGSVTLGARETQQFTATVSNAASTAVRWSIFPDLGTITQTGLYTAPAEFTGSPSTTVSAISGADGSKIGQATVTLVNRVTVVVGPATVSLLPGRTQQFTALVAGTANTAVTWSITPQIGTISATGLYTAPASFLNEAAITVRATSVAETSRSATATVNLTLPPVGPPPAITAAGVTNAATFRGAVLDGGISPGEIITIFGTNLGPATPVTLQLDGRGFVATRLGGTRVLFDGTPGPMIVTSAGQVSAVVPYSLEGLASVAVSVEYEGRASAQVPIPVAVAAPGIFTQNSSGSGPGSVIRQTGELVTAASPAGESEVLTLYATGDGATTPAGVDGKPTTAPLPLTKLPVRVLIDDTEVEPLYAGGAPGLVAGVLQVNFTMPAGTAGPRRLRLRIGDKLSPAGVTLPAR
jgi:uncharacterized protein (TIGR03437 family)